MKRLVLLCVLAVAAPLAVHAQPAATPPPVTNVEVDPIRCWWKTNTGGIRTGETFTLALTCAVLENEAVQVVPDESHLGAAVIQMAPFETVGGAHPADLRSGQRRFFQYEYNLRIINPDVIGRDVRIPDMVIHYRINSRIAANAAVQGRDLVYVLPPQSVRVSSLVPGDATDIRDASGESFGTSEALAFRASVLEITAIALISFGSLMVLLVLVRIARGSRRRTAVDQHSVSPGGMIGLALRDLGAVQREREQQGWTEPLIDRALGATRVAAAAALGRPINQRAVTREEQPGEGRLIRSAGRRAKSRTISSSVTAGTLDRAIARLPESDPDRKQLFEEFRGALATFGSRQYGRSTEFDTAALDGALSAATDAARRVRAQHRWPNALFRRWRGSEPALESQA